MSKSAMYTSNTTTQALAVGEPISLGSVIRRFGPNIKLNGESISVNGGGYYVVDASFTVTATTAGTVTITLLKDNVAVQGAVASASVAVGDVVTMSIDAIIREYGCCCDNNSVLTFVLGGTAESITNASVVVEKI